MNRWAEYNAGTLTPPCVVQHDFVSGLHLVWVWDGSRITGPYSREKYDEQELLDMASAIDQGEIIGDDPMQEKLEAATAEIVSLQEEIKTLQKKNVSLLAEIASLKKDL